uniref:F-box domain-containing protein n=1 Tax=Hordeum vulgare subsp. vulgare TaxID=112509 RepID=A0A8I6Y2E8_HORVV
MEDLPEAVVTEIVKKITRTSDLNSLSLVSKGLYTIEGNQRGAIRVGSGLCTTTEALTSLCTRLNSTPQITSIGLFLVAAGCTSLSVLHLIDCEKIDSVEWLEYLGRDGLLEELVVKNCKGINHHDFLKFGSGWMRLQKFEFERKRGIYEYSIGCDYYDPSYNAHSMDTYDFCCESLKDLRLAHIKTWPEIGLRVLLGKCKALENLWLAYVLGLNDNDLIALSRSCSNLKSITLWLNLQRHCSEDGYCESRTSFTDDSLYALALNCPMLQIVDFRFKGCSRGWSSEIGFTQDGFLALIQSCPIRVLVLNTPNFFDDKGMKALSSSPHLETLELILCHWVTDAGMRFIAHTPCLSHLTLRACHKVTDVGVAELGRADKLRVFGH